MKKVILAKQIGAILGKDRCFLDRSDIRVIPADTNEEILALHKTEKTDLIITDLDLPTMPGEDLCSLIRADNDLRKVSIIIVCAETPLNLQRCSGCGANAFITSPVNTAVLLQEAHHLLHITRRKTCRMPLKVRFEGKAIGKPFNGSIENISTAGLLFITEAVLFEGDAIQCSFDLPDSGSIHISAEVVRTAEAPGDREKRYGARFTEIGDADASEIEAFVNTKTGPHLSDH